MLRTITPKAMRALEQAVMAKTGITGGALMERAAGHVAEAVRRHMKGRPGQVLCLCGTGNNGGDGLAAMRLLAGDHDFAGSCWLLDGELSADAEGQLERLGREAPRVEVVRLSADATKGDAGVLSPDGSHNLASASDPSLPALNHPIACVIDALFGTGLSRPLTGMAATLCALMNRLKASGVPVVAVDIPSGLDGTTGEISGAAAEATETVTFHKPKPGLYLGYGLDCTGAVTVGDIGLSSETDDTEGFWIAQREDITLPPRKRLSHKGSYGRVLLWAGRRGMAGAAAICATAALRSGAGLVTVACEDGAVNAVQTLCPCATCQPLSTDAAEAWHALRQAVDKAGALGLGCGLGQSAATAGLFKRLLEYLSTETNTPPPPMVIDADGLNLLAGLSAIELEAMRPALSRAVLTPHPAEAARLLQMDCGKVTATPHEAAQALRDKYGAAVVLKGAASVLVAESGAALNILGTPAMAKGGSGDALTGVLTTLLAGRAAGAYEMNDLALLQMACGLHGLAGMAAERRFGIRGVLATDLCDCLGTVG